MISKSEIKFITSLRQKKYRDQHGLFIAEGPKVIGELLDSGYEVHSHFSVEQVNEHAIDSRVISEKELGRISSLKSPNNSLAVFHKKISIEDLGKGLTVALDSVRDPGNMGTIIRLCDWFGITQLICSLDTVDCYNPKVVQSTMGSLGRVAVHYRDLNSSLPMAKKTIYGAVMDGDELYNSELDDNAVIILGNESNGISEEVEAILDRRITIPRFGEQKKAESLNVATATAILLAEFRRQATGK